MRDLSTNVEITIYNTIYNYKYKLYTNVPDTLGSSDTQAGNPVIIHTLYRNVPT